MRFAALLILWVVVTACLLVAQEAVVSPETAALGQSWDPAYTADTPAFNIEPNAFLAEVVQGVTPGTALDVGMGQGRNAVYLASRGWATTGFDVSAAGVEQARARATAAGLNLTALVQSNAEFEWGTGRWDLIVLTYYPGLRQDLPRMLAALRPGGIVVVEAFHADAAIDRPPGPGPGVTFRSGELPTLFESLRVVRYEEPRARADWGLFETRLVRLAAQKPG